MEDCYTCKWSRRRPFTPAELNHFAQLGLLCPPSEHLECTHPTQSQLIDSGDMEDWDDCQYFVDGGD